MLLHSLEAFALFLCLAFPKGFTFFCIICLLGRVVFKNRAKEEFINILTAVNLGLALGALPTFIYLGSELYMSYISSSPYERFSSLPVTVYFQITASWLGWLIALLFYSRRWRSSWQVSAIVLVLLNSGVIIQWIIRLLQGYYGTSSSDPGTTTHYLFTGLEILLFGVIAILAYRWLDKRKKLPYPSAWQR